MFHCMTTSYQEKKMDVLKYKEEVLLHQMQVLE